MVITTVVTKFRDHRTRQGNKLVTRREAIEEKVGALAFFTFAVGIIAATVLLWDKLPASAFGPPLVLRILMPVGALVMTLNGWLYWTVGRQYANAYKQGLTHREMRELRRKPHVV